MSYRLTKWDRESIQKRAIEAAFKERTEALAKDEDRLGRRAYEHLFTTAERKAAKALPDNWLRRDACLRFNVDGLSVLLTLSDGGVPVPYRGKGSQSGGYSCSPLGAIQNGPLADEIKAHLKALEDLKQDRDRAKHALWAVLQSVSTLKGLQTAWPEGEPFWSALASRANEPNVPAPRIEELNAMLGLPLREAA
jgi:hypothetical protein